MAMTKQQQEHLVQCIKEWRKRKKKSVPLVQLCADFYLLSLEEHLSLLEHQAEPFSRHKEARHQRILSERDAVTDVLDRCFIGYLAAACFGECRYGLRHNADHTYYKMVDCGSVKKYHDYYCRAKSGGSRCKCTCRPVVEANTNQRYDVQDAALSLPESKLVKALYLCQDLLTNGKWEASVGGEAWARICDTLIARLEERYSPAVFVDRVFDLQHNGGLCLDKTEVWEWPLGVWLRQFQRILDEKLEAKQPDDYELCLSVCDQSTLTELEPRLNLALKLRLKLIRESLTKSSVKCPRCHVRLYGLVEMVDHSHEHFPKETDE